MKAADEGQRRIEGARARRRGARRRAWRGPALAAPRTVGQARLVRRAAHARRERRERLKLGHGELILAPRDVQVCERDARGGSIRFERERIQMRRRRRHARCAGACGALALALVLACRVGAARGEEEERIERARRVVYKMRCLRLHDPQAEWDHGAFQ